MILQWVTHSARPLRFLKLAEVVRLSTPLANTLKDAKRLVSIACGSLLEILEDETVSVIHHSFTEFLTDPARESTAVGLGTKMFPVINFRRAHRQLGLKCIRYLQSCYSFSHLEEMTDDEVRRLRCSRLCRKKPPITPADPIIATILLLDAGADPNVLSTSGDHTLHSVSCQTTGKSDVVGSK